MTTAWKKALFAGSEINGAIDESPEQHAITMGGYDQFLKNSESIDSLKSHFLNKNYQSGRLLYYEDFLDKHILKGERVLSIASGHCVNEVSLINKGVRVVCSDLKKNSYHDHLKSLVDDFEMRELNILENSEPECFDAVFGLSLIYLFSEPELKRYLTNAKTKIRLGGKVIVEATGSPAHFFSIGFHNYYLLFEARVISWVRRIRGKKEVFVVKNHGYLRPNSDIVLAASELGLRLIDAKDYEFGAEFERSRIIAAIIGKWPSLRPTVSFFGRLLGMPYIRMFCFENTKNINGDL